MLLFTETQGNAEGFTPNDEPDVTTMDDVNMEESDEEKNEEGNEEVSDEDSPWTPEEVDQAYTKEGDDDDSQKSSKPR